MLYWFCSHVNCLANKGVTLKFGARKPSLKKSVSARTKGRVTRVVKKASTPAYGRKGKGAVTQPKKSAYNKVYGKTTFSWFK